ncbi:MAG: undecaprenyl-diphosphate phosphatase [Clostridia bacterium]
MLEIIKVIILAIFSGTLLPLPVSASAHFALLNDLLSFSTDENVITVYTSIFALAFSVALIFNLRKIYFNLFKSLFVFNKEKLEKKKLTSYKSSFLNLLLSFIPLAIVFAPVSEDKLLIDYFSSFNLSTNLILVGIASVFLGFIMIISSWYSKYSNSKIHRISKMGDIIRMSIYQVPSYIIPGLSQVASGVSKLIIRDVNSKTVMREVYTYLAPQMLVISIIQLVRMSYTDVSILPITAVIGAIIAFVVSEIVIALISKFNIKKLFSFFAVYSIILGVYIIAVSVTL